MLNTITNTATIARRYFEIKTAYNIDRFRFQSMVSTAHKLLTLHNAIMAGKQEQALDLADSVSDHWFHAAMGSSLFSEHRGVFQAVHLWLASEGRTFDQSPIQYSTDTYCQYILMLPPLGSPHIFNLSNSETAVPEFVRAERGGKANGVLKIGSRVMPIYDFTRRECGPSYNIVSGYWPTV